MADTTPGLDWKAFTPDDSPKTPMDIGADPRLKDLSTPDLAIGDIAFDFELPVFDYSEGVEQKAHETFHLASAAKDRPIALIFGSYT